MIALSLKFRSDIYYCLSQTGHEKRKNKFYFLNNKEKIIKHLGLREFSH